MNRRQRPGWLRQIARSEQVLLVAALAAIVLLSFLQIILRNAFDTAWYWIDPFTRHLVLVLMFGGGARAADRLSHLRIDLLSPYLPQGWRRWTNRASWLLAALLTLILAVAAWSFVLQAYVWNDGTPLTRALLWFIPGGWFLMAFHFLVAVIWPEPEESR